MAVIQKRKRGIRTSVFQYETYLSFMEDCYVFRSGTIDPTVPPNYIERKWQELTDILNRCDVGPVLTSSQWQTRFHNWKNSTRQKYRAYVAEQKQTGGGPQNEKPLSALEERGLEVWGRVAVTGTPKVPHVGGLQFRPQEVGLNNTPLNDVSESTEIFHIVSEETDNTDDSDYICIETIVPEETATTSVSHQNISTPNFILNPALELQNSSSNSTVSIPPQSNGRLKNYNRKRKLSVGTSNRTMKSVSAELLTAYQSDCNLKKTECEKNELEMNRRINLEKVKLQFEIAKYKFENPRFQFDEAELSNI